LIQYELVFNDRVKPASVKGGRCPRNTKQQTFIEWISLAMM